MTDKEMLEYLYEGYSSSVNCIKRELHKTCENAVTIGFYLSEIKRCGYWKATDYYKNFKPGRYTTASGLVKLTEYTFYDYCHDEFNFSRRSVDRYINIYFAFASVNPSGTRTMFIDEKYKDYTASQLAEMLQLNDKQRNKVNPDMTVKDIRKLKSFLSKNVSETANEDESNTGDSNGSFSNKDNNALSVLSDNTVNVQDIDISFDKQFDDKTFKKKKYHVCDLLYDKFISTCSQYTQQFIKLQEYLNKGYLVRMVLYEPDKEDEENNKERRAANE